MGRGQLTEKANKIAVEKIGREITLGELRLLPYVQFVMMNDQKLDPRRVSANERKILSKWRKEEHIAGGAGGMKITKDFWDFMSAVLFETYVVF